MADTNVKKYVSLDKLTKYDAKIKGVISAGDATTLSEAKKYADSLATNYDAAGSAATVQGKLDTEIARAKAAEEAAQAAADKAQGEVDALELVVAEIQRNAYNDTELRGLISGLDENKADKTQVATDIAAAVKVETDARVEAVQGVQGAVDTLSQTHATDKKALEDAIALKADQTSLDAVSAVANAAATQTALQAEIDRAKGEEARIEGLVTAEAERALEVEGDFETRISAMEVFWDVTEDSDGVINKLKEIQDYIAGDESGAAEMAGNIQANTQAISAMDTAYKAADTTLQGNIDALSGVVATKAAASDVTALDGRVTTAEGKITTLEGKMATAESEIDALQALFGEGDGTVADMIADAVAGEAALREAGDEAAIAAAAGDATSKANKALEDAKKYADEEDAKIESRVDALESASATHALASDLTALTGRVETAEGEIDTLQSEMDAVEALAAANKSAHEANAAAIALKASQADLEAAVARIAKNEADIAAFVEVSEAEINALFA